jgi:hypothetical protein
MATSPSLSACAQDHTEFFDRHEYVKLSRAPWSAWE